MPNDRVTRSEVVRTAQSFLGTPWRHQGRSRLGCDCVGLVAAVAEEVGILPANFEVPSYRRTPDGKLLNYFDRYMDRIYNHQIKDGSVVIFSFYGSPWHAGIVVNVGSRAIVHAFATQRKVVTDYLDNKQNNRKFHRAYDYREIADG